MTLYCVKVCTFSCNIYGVEYIDSYWSSKDKAEDHILKSGLLDQGHQSVAVEQVLVDTVYDYDNYND